MFSRLFVRLLLAAAMALPAFAAERNAWPFWVGQEDPATGQISSQQILGPLYASQTNPDGSAQQVLRPLWLKTTKDETTTSYFLYPFFTWQRTPDSRSFSFFQLINQSRSTAPSGPDTHRFDVWPFYFSRDTGNPATSYHALFPVAGTIKNRFGKDRLTWYFFPLYFNTDKAGMQITSVPWPFIRVINGTAGHHGFEFWPLFGFREHPGDYRSQFYLWPLGYKDEQRLSAPQPDVKLGVLPFYAREYGPGYLSETYAWPFVGYTHRTIPAQYDEIRYFWPFLVQGRGDQQYVNRYAPFYTHSIIKGYDKTWMLWPLYRHASWSENGIAQKKDTVLFFLYSSVKQRSLTNLSAAPAYKTHLWPLFTVWDNGAGRRQTQVLSPLEIIFPHSDQVRQLYTPLFAVYRFDQRAPGDTRHSLLWNLIGWKNSPAGKEFHFGPLGWHRDSDAPQGKFFFFASHAQSAKPAPVPSPP